MGNKRMGDEYEKVYVLRSLHEICSYVQLIDTKKSNSTETKNWVPLAHCIALTSLVAI